LPLVDGPEKVSGRAKYTADLIAPGMLAGRIFRSPHSHAEILEVDVSEARKLEGVSDFLCTHGSHSAVAAWSCHLKRRSNAPTPQLPTRLGVFGIGRNIRQPCPRSSPGVGRL
jgi:hypothetical protein